MGLIFGFNAALYILPTGTRASWGTVGATGLASAPPPTGLVLVTNVEDAKLITDSNEANVTTRVSQGYEMTAPSLAKVELSFKMIWDTTDTNLLAFLTAHSNRTTVAIAALDTPKTTVGAIGFWADWSVIKFEKDESLQEAQQVDITLKPGYSQVPPQWVEVTAS
jgi:hypothetical protein